MKKLIFLISFFLLTTVNNRLVSADMPKSEHHDDIAIENTCGGKEMPIGDGEEKSEEDKDVSEEDDDLSLDHRQHSRNQSSSAGLHLLYQEIIFQNLDSEVVIPPPKA